MRIPSKSDILENIEKIYRQYQTSLAVNFFDSLKRKTNYFRNKLKKAQSTFAAEKRPCPEIDKYLKYMLAAVYIFEDYIADCHPEHSALCSTLKDTVIHADKFLETYNSPRYIRNDQLLAFFCEFLINSRDLSVEKHNAENLSEQSEEKESAKRGRKPQIDIIPLYAGSYGTEKHIQIGWYNKANSNYWLLRVKSDEGESHPIKTAFNEYLAAKGYISDSVSFKSFISGSVDKNGLIHKRVNSGNDKRLDPTAPPSYRYDIQKIIGDKKVMVYELYGKKLEEFYNRHKK